MKKDARWLENENNKTKTNNIFNNMIDLNILKDCDLLTADKNSLVDIKDIVINENETIENKVLSYLEKIHNPYLFRCGDIAIKLKYSDDSTKTFEDIFVNLLKNSQTSI